ncbi:hypothetical protein C8R43DRAFT_1137726 [Mycena crocata]|nr:hypothetical protein C8R43DRAFT_1137726 [Mycena crocata]
MTPSTRLADRARLVDLELRIKNTERALSDLKLEKRHTQARLYAYKYPVLTLPNEIVSEIFTQFLPPYPLCPPSTGLHSPIVFTKVCRIWREIALATPALWRAVAFPFGMPDSEERTKFLMAWLAGSRSLPLSIRMDSEYDPIMLTDWSVLVPHSGRWEILQLTTHQPIDLECLASSMPRLRQLELTITQRPSRHVVIRQAPQLRTVTLGVLASTSVALYCPQLTSLTLSCIYADRCHPILQNSPSLIHFGVSLVCFRPDEEDTEELELINLPFLESLVLSRFLEHGAPVTRLLETFIVPVLHTLEIPDDFLAPEALPALTSFLESSGCTLQNACITGKRSVSRTSYRAAFPTIAFSFKSRLLEESAVAVPEDDSDVESDDETDDGTDEEDSDEEDSDEDDYSSLQN